MEEHRTLFVGYSEDQTVLQTMLERMAGTLLTYGGDLERAKDLLEESLSLARSRSHARRTSLNLARIAATYFSRVEERR